MNLELLNKFETAIGSVEMLLELVSELKANNYGQLAVYHVFAEYHQILIQQEREKDQDVLEEVLERIYGWCPRDYWLFKEALTNHEIDRFRKNQNL